MGTYHTVSDAIDRHTLLGPVYIATGLISIAEVVYVAFFGMILFPGGSLTGKIIWALTCGIAMGAVVGVATVFLTSDGSTRHARMVIAAGVMTVVGSYCSWLCSRIDARFDYFGGPENTGLFIASGLIPAVLGGFLYGWLIYLLPRAVRSDRSVPHQPTNVK